MLSQFVSSQTGRKRDQQETRPGHAEEPETKWWVSTEAGAFKPILCPRHLPLPTPPSPPPLPPLLPPILSPILTIRCQKGIPNEAKR